MNQDLLCINCMSRLEYPSNACPKCGFINSTYVTPESQLTPYTRLGDGRYILGRGIGSGGFGITYIGFDNRLQIPVAIKELFVASKVRRCNGKTILIDTTQRGVEQYELIKRRFMREARTMAEMETVEGLVKIKDYFAENETAYIVMEYLAGSTLKNVIEGTGRIITLDETLRLLAPVTNALSQLHAAGIIHRDVSLDNIMLLNDGRTKLIDLGGEKRVDDAGEMTIAFMKSYYTPIEQILGRSAQIGPRTDVYALAVTIYRCITGRFPKPVSERDSDDDIVLPSTLGVRLSKEQEEALMHALRLDPQERTQTVEELITGLTDWSISKKESEWPGGSFAGIDIKYFVYLIILFLTFCLSISGIITIIVRGLLFL